MSMVQMAIIEKSIEEDISIPGSKKQKLETKLPMIYNLNEAKSYRQPIRI